MCLKPQAEYSRKRSQGNSESQAIEMAPNPQYGTDRSDDINQGGNSSDHRGAIPDTAAVGSRLTTQEDQERQRDQKLRAFSPMQCDSCGADQALAPAVE